VKSLNRDNTTLKEQVENCLASETRTQRHYQDLIERMRVDNSHMIRVLQEKHEFDKTALRTEYETLIATIREEYQTQKNELRESMKKLEIQLSMHQKEFKNLQQMFDHTVAKMSAQIAELEALNRDQA